VRHLSVQRLFALRLQQRTHVPADVWVGFSSLSRCKGVQCNLPLTLFCSGQVPRLLVFVKTLSMEDECASATIKDPTGTGAPRLLLLCAEPAALVQTPQPCLALCTETLLSDKRMVTPGRRNEGYDTRRRAGGRRRSPSFWILPRSTQGVYSDCWLPHRTRTPGRRESWETSHNADV
jgi:hypothetical protein